MPYPLFHPERAAGVHPKLQACAVYVAAHCDFPVGIPYQGGLRTQADVDEIRARGDSNATTLDETPHGSGCGLDMAPWDTVGHQPDWNATDKFAQISQLIKDFGMVCGDTFVLPNGGNDPGHAELPNWQQVRDTWRATVGLDPSAGGIAVALAAVFAVGGLIALFVGWALHG